MAANIPLNRMLTTRGYKNITEDYGMGKTNSDWEGCYIKIKRRKMSTGNIRVIITARTDQEKLCDTLIIKDGERNEAALKNVMTIIERWRV